MFAGSDPPDLQSFRQYNKEDRSWHKKQNLTVQIQRSLPARPICGYEQRPFTAGNTANNDNFHLQFHLSFIVENATDIVDFFIPHLLQHSCRLTASGSGAAVDEEGRRHI